VARQNFQTVVWGVDATGAAVPINAKVEVFEHGTTAHPSGAEGPFQQSVGAPAYADPFVANGGIVDFWMEEGTYDVSISDNDSPAKIAPYTVVFDSPQAFDYGSGAPNLALPGSGFAQPKGLECVWEYGPLRMNDLTVFDKYRVQKISGLDGADIRTSAESNTQDHGEVIGQQFFGGRTIVLEGRIETLTMQKMNDMEQALRQAFLSINRDLPLAIRSGSTGMDAFIMCRITAKPNIDRSLDNMQMHRAFMLTLRAQDPRVLSYNQHNINQDVTADITTLTPLNMGNFDAQPIITLHGPLTRSGSRIRLSCIELGLELDYQADIAPGHYVVFDTAKRTAVDDTGAEVFTNFTFASDMMRFAPGYSTIELEAHGYGTGSYIDLVWRDTWM
jgi:hypothetical protein